MARGRSSRRGVKSEINIVPLLDVLLVLLLIFMATAPIISQSVEVDLPEATACLTLPNAINACIIPHTVPNRPIYGLIEPTVPFSQVDHVAFNRIFYCILGDYYSAN